MPTPIAGWFTSRGVVAFPGYFIADTPWAGHKAFVGADATRNQVSTHLSGGSSYTGGANHSTTKDHYLSAGTFKFAFICVKDTNCGIAEIKFDASAQGTIDTYAAAAVLNSYNEITGLVVTAGVKVVSIGDNGKNASSSSFQIIRTSYAIVRTGP